MVATLRLAAAQLWMFEVERQGPGGMNFSPFPPAPRFDVLLGAGKRVRHAADADDSPTFEFVAQSCQNVSSCIVLPLFGLFCASLSCLLFPFLFFYPVLLPLLPTFLLLFRLPLFCFLVFSSFR